MKLTHDDIDYEKLIDIHEELAIVMAEVVGADWSKTSNEAYMIIEGINNINWALLDMNKVYIPALRKVAAACIYALIEITERNK